MAQQVRYFLSILNKGTNNNKEGQKENDVEVLIERNGGCSRKLEYLPMTRIRHPFLRMVQEVLLCPLLPLLCGLFQMSLRQ